MNNLLRSTSLIILLGLLNGLHAAQFPILLEAEKATLHGDLATIQAPGFSGNEYVHNFHINADSYYIFENVEVEKAGMYEFKAYSMGSSRPFSIKVNDYARSVIRSTDSPNWDTPPSAVSSALIYMDAGRNTLKIGSEKENGPNLDKFEIHTSIAPINKPERVKAVFPYDFTDGATVSSTHNNATLINLTDNDENTYYEVNGTNSVTVTIDCQEQKVITSMLLYAGKEINVSNWRVQYSRDGNIWKTLRPTSSRMIGMGDISLFAYTRLPGSSSTFSARYFRFTATGTDKIRIAEWQLFGFNYDITNSKPLFQPDITEGLSLEKAITGSPSSNDNENIFKLFDKQLTTKYCVHKNSFYVQCVLDKAYTINSYSLTSANDAPERDPKLWSLSGYNPQVGWIELDEQRDFSFPGRHTTMTFPIVSNKEFTAFMLEVSDVRFGNIAQLSNIQVVGSPTGNPSVPPEKPSNPSTNPKERAAELVRLMTKSEKLSYVGGIDWMYTKPIPRLGIPQVKMSDGPQGVGTWGSSTAYPCGICLSATWNEALAHSYGKALAFDSRANGVNVLLGPAVNIHRAPMCGRNFEYMGEDPHLTSRTAVGYIKGLQENGVMAVIKHFAANYQEYDRNYISSDIDERTLHEIYFPAFKAAVQEAKVGSVMSSYNLLNGTWTTHHPWLLRTVLREQWGFDGILMSDWGSTHACLAAAQGGLDLEMAGGERMNPDSLRYYIGKGELDMSVIDEKVQNILQTLIKFGFLDRQQLDTSIPKDNPTSVKTALDVAREGMVLLKNKNNILPLKRDKIKKVAVVGQNALGYMTGGGSGRVVPIHYTSFYEGIKSIGSQKSIEVEYIDEFDHLDNKVTLPSTDNYGFKGEYFNNINLSGTPIACRTDNTINFNFQNGCGIAGIETSNFGVRWTADLRPTESGQYTFHLGGDDGFRLFINDSRAIDDWNPGQERYKTHQMSLTAGQNYKIRIEYYQSGGASLIDFYWTKAGAPDHFQASLNAADVVIACFGHTANSEAEGSDRTFKLPAKQAETIEKVMSKTRTPIIGVVTAGGNVEMQSWENRLHGLLWAWYPGQEGGTALGEILFGNVNPSGKLPITFEKQWADNPTYNSYYDDNNDKHVAFTEGIFMGYRGYDKAGKAVQYPFGFGLSYSTFSVSEMTVTPATEANALITLSCKLENTSNVAGAQVVQVYVGKNGTSKVARAIKELKAYKKVFLLPGASQTVTFKLDESAFSFYDVDEQTFVLDEGTYDISIGFSSSELPLKEEINVKNSTGIETVTTNSNTILIPTKVKAGESVKIRSGVASQIDIYNTSGNLTNCLKNTDSIPTSGYSKGMYLVRIDTHNKNAFGRFIIQ